LLAALSLAAAARAQEFGQNQVRVRGFDWKVVSTAHFDLHYYEGSAPMVPFAAQSLERAYARLSRELHQEFDARRPFFLYAGVNDMQQSNIVEVGDGTGGVTEAFKNRFMVFHDGSKAWLETVIAHELTHVFQYQILLSGFWRSADILKLFVYPLWMMEGSAEHYSGDADETAGTVILRDAATSDTLIPLWKLEHFSHLKPHQVRLAYESGGEAVRFLETEYGRGMAEKLLRYFESRFDSGGVLHDLIGLDLFGFNRRWLEHVKERYARAVGEQRLQEPTAYGEALTAAHDDIPEFNTSPVFTPDGRSMAYLTTRYGHPPAVVLQDLRTGRVRKLMSHLPSIETVHLGNFDNKSRALAISPDGRELAFAGTKNHRDALYFQRVRGGRPRRVPLPGFMSAAQPCFSPDGRSVAFSGMRDAQTDIYLLDRESGKVRRLTDDPNDDQTPSFSPDGKSVVYSSEIETPGDPMPYQRRLYRVRLADGGVERLLELRGAARDPVHSPDGRKILFTLEADGTYDVHELDLASGRAARLTRSVGAAYTPAYAPSGELAFAALRRGSVHLYKGARARFGDEPPASAAVVAGGPPEVAASTVAARTGDPRPAVSPFGTDLFLPLFFYSSNGGFFWTSYWQGSDLLGNHQAQSLVSYGSGEGYLDYQTDYRYARFRPDLRAGVVGHLRNDAYDGSSGLTADQSAHAQYVGASYPFDRYDRIELLAASITERTAYQETALIERRESRLGSAALVRDTVRGRYLVETAGSRLRLGYVGAPRILGANSMHQSIAADAIRYVPAGAMSALVLRGFAVQNWGPDARQFELGGIGRVRGYGRSDVTDIGIRGALATAEWRMPIFGNLDYYMWYIFPDFYFKAVSLAVFSDAGAVADSEGQARRTGWGGIRHSAGFGLRLHTFILQLFPLVIHFDYAWPTTHRSSGIFYVYIGPLF